MPSVAYRESWWLPGLYRDEQDYYRYDDEMDAETFTRACMHVGRNDGPSLLFDLYYGGALAVHLYPEVVAAVWSMAEFPANLLPPETWVELFEEAGYTQDGKPASRPEQPVTVYRGCHHERRFGMSWSTDRERAKWFADRFSGFGNMYVFTAPPMSLLAFIHHEVGRGEEEYVIDSSYLSDETVKLHT
jgi:hypothetical protein